MARQRITLNVAGESFDMTIDDSREDIHRFAARKINSRVAELEGKYEMPTGKALAIAALEISIQSMDMERSRSLGSEIDALEALDRKLGDYLNKL